MTTDNYDWDEQGKAVNEYLNGIDSTDLDALIDAVVNNSQQKFFTTLPTENEIEAQASKHEVTVDYYLDEFLID